MIESINFGIGFITGRPNVCNIINSYCKDIIEQVKVLNCKVNFTIFILYDLNYLNTKKEDYYNIDTEILNNVKIKYLTPEYVQEKKEKIAKKMGLSKEKVELVIGTGYAKSRNSILHDALEEKIDYLLFWDDDEYPLAAIKDEDKIKWIKQNNVLQHLKYIENVEVTYGYRCGMINPLPFVKYNNIVTEDIYRQFIEALENEVISWEKLQKMFANDSAIGYAKEEIATYKEGVEEVKDVGKKNFVLGSGICLNLRRINKIPAFYNPPEARGEDTFFSCALGENNAQVLRVPVYHFHDTFLKFTFLMKNNFPKKLRKITADDGISLRFKRTTTGWAKYKPLLYYMLDKENYRSIMDEAKDKLENSSKYVSTIFPDCDLTDLSLILKQYDSKVEQHYKEYLETNQVWNTIKDSMKAVNV